MWQMVPAAFYQRCWLNGDEIKFGDKEEDFQKVCDKIDANLFGIFSPFNQQR